MSEAPDTPRRTPAQWTILLLAWLIGLALWVLYLFLIGALVVRLFS